MDTRIVVAHVTQARGGVEQAIGNIVRHLDEDRFACHVIAPPGEYAFVTRSGKAVTLHAAPFARAISPWSDARALQRTTALLKAIRPDLVHAHSSKGGFIGRLAAKRLAIPTLYTPHAFAFLAQAPGLWRAHLYRRLERLAAPWTSGLLACSEAERQAAIHRVGFPADRVFIWRNAVDPAEFAAPRPPVYDFPYFCTLSRPSYQKNPRMLVELVRRLRERGVATRCVLVGAGFPSPLLADLARQIRRHGLTEAFVVEGWLPHARAMAILAHAVCYVSTARYEGLPFSVLEAMALGKVVVATDVEGNRECVVDGHTGRLTPPDDAAGMAEIVADMLGNAPMRERMGEAARQRIAEAFDITRTIGTLESRYEATARRPTARSS